MNLSAFAMMLLGGVAAAGFCNESTSVSPEAQREIRAVVDSELLRIAGKRRIALSSEGCHVVIIFHPVKTGGSSVNRLVSGVTKAEKAAAASVHFKRSARSMEQFRKDAAAANAIDSFRYFHDWVPLGDRACVGGGQAGASTPNHEAKRRMCPQAALAALLGSAVRGGSGGADDPWGRNRTTVLRLHAGHAPLLRMAPVLQALRTAAGGRQCQLSVVALLRDPVSQLKSIFRDHW